jgi:hypothetical protein
VRGKLVLLVLHRLLLRPRRRRQKPGPNPFASQLKLRNKPRVAMQSMWQAPKRGNELRQ